MVFDTTLSQSDLVKEVYKEAMLELCNWYEINWKKNTPKLLVINDKETFMSIAGSIKPEWVRGFGDYCNNIFVYSPEAQEKYTIHKYKEKDYYAFIKHELDHRFFYIHTKNLKYPKWLVEGHAGYVADQILYSNPVTKFEKFLDMNQSMESSAYSESGYAVKLLVEKVGKKPFLSFLSGLSEKDFEDEFSKVFQMDLTYDSFNLLLKEKAGR